MKTVFAAFAIAAIAATAAVPANAQMSALKSLNNGAAASESAIVHKTGRKGRRIAAGIALGIIGAAALASGAHAYDRDYEEERYWRRRNRCNRWRRWCRRGNDRSCWKYDNRC